MEVRLCILKTIEPARSVVSLIQVHKTRGYAKNAAKLNGVTDEVNSAFSSQKFVSAFHNMKKHLSPGFLPGVKVLQTSRPAGRTSLHLSCLLFGAAQLHALVNLFKDEHGFSLRLQSAITTSFSSQPIF